MKTEVIEMVKVAGKPYRELDCKEGETCLLIADTVVEPIIWQSFAAAANNMGITTVVQVIPKLAHDFQDPPMCVQKAAQEVDIIHFLTTTGLVHSPFGKKLASLGKKRIISEGITSQMLVEGGAFATKEEIRDIVNRLSPYWDNGEQVQLTSSAGTDFRISVKGRSCYSLYSKKGSSPAFVTGKGPRAQFPGGECPVAPVEESGEGVLVFDIGMHYPPGLLRHPVTCRIEKGRITSIKGGYEADEYETWLKTYGDNNSNMVGEISHGANPKAKYMGSMRQDRFVIGSFHVGFGMNTDVGGVVESKIHYDAIMSRVTVTVDGKTIVKEGKLLV